MHRFQCGKSAINSPFCSDPTINEKNNAGFKPKDTPFSCPVHRWRGGGFTEGAMLSRLKMGLTSG
jgi:hypothetical protein